MGEGKRKERERKEKKERGRKKEKSQFIFFCFPRRVFVVFFFSFVQRSFFRERERK